MKNISIFIIGILISSSINAQYLWNRNRLDSVKRHLDYPGYAMAYKQLISEANSKLTVEPYSVTYKAKTPPSGDKHDYMSQARYFWPNNESADSLPYIQRDGLSNPEIDKLDRNRLGNMCSAVTTLTLAAYLSGNEQYATKAVEILRIWFINKGTRMNPNLNYAQVVPGHFNNQGRSYGLIDTYSFVEMLNAVQLLETTKAYTKNDDKELKKWFRQYLQWFLNSPQGHEEHNAANNHGTAYDIQAAAFALFCGDKNTAEKFVNEFPKKRIFTQIEPDGKQPFELKRTLAFGYSEFNIRHMMDMFAIAANIGKADAIHATSADGRCFIKAVDFLIPYFENGSSSWPYQQISEWDYKTAEFNNDLYRLSTMDSALAKYAKHYKPLNWNQRETLLYMRPEEAKSTTAFFDNQLHFAIDCANAALSTRKNPALTSPRCVEPDGSLRLVQPRDWCSGFFPGMLWMMYQISGNDYWRKNANLFTLPTESNRLHRGTHDLGFMVHNSFGKGYTLTNEKAYFDVDLQAAQTLCKRYNPNVKAIRSWDHNKNVWDYPVIIDNMINLELLFWATEQTGNSSFYKIAVNHANTTMANHFRDDFSTFHVVDYNPDNGNVRSKCTHQGFSDESVWSRGQAWGLYGYTMCYRFTGDSAYLRQAENIAKFIFAQAKMPEDLIPYWDMNDPKIPNAPRDASAAAVTASALYELCRYSANHLQYKNLADKIMNSLKNNYQSKIQTNQGFLLEHSTGNHPANDEIDVPIIYADYYYMEAVIRKSELDNEL